MTRCSLRFCFASTGQQTLSFVKRLTIKKVKDYNRAKISGRMESSYEKIRKKVFGISP